MRQDKLFGAHEIQRFNRDADETVAWITEKDVVLSSDDYGRDLATVQTLQVRIGIFYLLIKEVSELQHPGFNRTTELSSQYFS